MLSEISYEQISGNYCYGIYGDFRVIMMKNTGYINATKMCSSGGKRFHEWKSNKTSQALLHALEEMLGTGEASNFRYGDETKALRNSETGNTVSVCKCITTENITAEDKLISGTYCHPDLIPHIGCWISPSFALKVSSIVNNYLVKEYQTKLEDTRAALQSSQESLANSQFENGRLEGVIDDWRDVVDFKNDTIQIKTEALAKVETELCDNIIEKQNWTKTHTFALLKLHQDTAKRPYYVIRCQNSHINTAINKLRRKHSQAEVIWIKRTIPNAINLYSRIKEQQLMKGHHNYCQPTLNDGQLLDALNSLTSTVRATSNIAPFNAWMM